MMLERWSFRARLAGDCRLGADRLAPADLDLVFRPGRERGLFDVEGNLVCPALGGQRRAHGAWRALATARAFAGIRSRQGAALELDLEGLHFRGHHDTKVPRGLMRASFFVGQVDGRAGAHALLRLRFDVRHDLLALLRSVRLGDRIERHP